MAESLSPFVYWGQNSERIFLKVDLREVSDAKVKLTEDGVSFKALGLGVQGKRNYAFDIELYLPIDPEKSKYRITDRFVEFQIQKIGIGESWPRLTYKPGKPAWLKIDFDHFAFEDSSEDDIKNEVEEERQMLKKLEKEFKDVKLTTFSDIKTFYLFVYNMFMWVGYSYVFICLSFRYWKHGEASKQDTFHAVGPQLMVCQIAAILEALHPLVGFVKTSPLMPMIQVFGRNLCLFGLILQEEKLQEREVIWWLFLTWSAVELVRYPYYMLNTISVEWTLITWLRYTVWIPLYPLGFMLEGFLMLLALPYFERSDKWSLNLPNVMNMSFHFPTFLRIYMLAFLPGMYLLMRRMYEQRKKKIKPVRKPRSRLAKKKVQ